MSPTSAEEIWAAAQLAPGEGIEDGVARVNALLGHTTLLDHFAGLAMQGICSHQDTWGASEAGIARAAYQMAKEMLEERARLEAES